MRTSLNYSVVLLRVATCALVTLDMRSLLCFAYSNMTYPSAQLLAADRCFDILVSGR